MVLITVEPRIPDPKNKLWKTMLMFPPPFADGPSLLFLGSLPQKRPPRPPPMPPLPLPSFLSWPFSSPFRRPLVLVSSSALASLACFRHGPGMGLSVRSRRIVQDEEQWLVERGELRRACVEQQAWYNTFRIILTFRNKTGSRYSSQRSVPPLTCPLMHPSMKASLRTCVNACMHA